MAVWEAGWPQAQAPTMFLGTESRICSAIEYLLGYVLLYNMKVLES